MESIFISAVELLHAYPEAPYVIGAISFIFLISLTMVLREIAGWFFKTSSLQKKMQKIEQELKALNIDIQYIADRMEDKPDKKAAQDLNPKIDETPAKNSGKGFPLSH